MFFDLVNVVLAVFGGFGSSASVDPIAKFCGPWVCCEDGSCDW